MIQTHSERGAERSTSRSEARDSSRAQQPGPVVSAEEMISNVKSVKRT